MRRMHHTAVEAGQKSRGPVINMKSRARRHELAQILTSRSRAKEKCESRTGTITSRGGHIPYK